MTFHKINYFGETLKEEVLSFLKDLPETAPEKTKIFFERTHIFFKPYLHKMRHMSLPMIIGVGAAGAIILISFAVFTYAVFISDLATPEKLMNRNNTGIILMDRKGEPFYHAAEAHDIKVYPIEKMPEYLPKAVVAIEDDEFYTHPGFSIRGIFRASVANLKSSSAYSQGASTITQQLVKNALLSPKKSYVRKLQEVLLAFEIERKYSKDQILEMYLNSIYYGSGAYGIQEASQLYFGKDPSTLRVEEAAILAALPQAPSAMTPFGGDTKRLFDRQKIILKKMGYDPDLLPKVTFAENKELKSDLAPHFSVWIRDYLYKKYGENEVNRLGFRVTTTLDSRYQRIANTLVSQHVKNLNRRDATNAGLVAMNPKTGEILAMVGSADWYNEDFGKFNVVFAKRQPGSTFKPIVYTKAFMDGSNPEDTVVDEPINIDGYQPKNSDGTYRGEVTLRRALANSLNIPAVKILQQVGVKNALKLAGDMGIVTLDQNRDYGLSLVLGGGEVTLFEITRAFGVLANQGEFVSSHPILRIEDKYGNEIYQYSPVSGKSSEDLSDDSIFSSFTKPREPLAKMFIGIDFKKQVIDNASAYLTTSILSDNEARKEVFGEQNWLTLGGRPAAAKTGTTNDFRDAWTVGYTPSLVVGVWVGNNDNSPMRGLYGSQAASPIWNGFMRQALAGTDIEDFDTPPGIIKVKLCKDTQKFCELCTDTFERIYSKKYLPPEDCSNITPTPTETPTPEPTSTPQPTATPTLTPIPTSTPTPIIAPTSTTSPTPTDAVVPTIINTLVPTITPDGGFK